MPPELRDAIDACRLELMASSRHEVSFAARRRLLRALGPQMLDERGFGIELTPGKRCRVTLALTVAQRVASAWARDFGGGQVNELLSLVRGYLEETTTLTGQPAAQRVRVKPLQAQTNYWRALSTESLTRPSRLVRTTADVAFAQASELLGPHKSDGEGVLLAIPAGYTREQLGLLLGVINETGVNVAGVVDAALAACSLEPAPARALHLDLELHQALLTVLDYAGTKGSAGDRGGLKRNRYEIAPRHGLMALQQTWMQMIAENFVRNTRFDPLHDAASEQRLLDLLPEWLTALQENERITLALQFGERPLEIELERA